MSDPLSYAAFESSPWFPCKNIGSARIPPFGAVEIDAPEGVLLRDQRRVVLRVKQPTILGVTGRTMWNGPTPMETGDTGACTDGRIVVSAFNDADGMPAAGEIWGPVADSCKLRKHVPGGRVLRSVQNGQDRVMILRYEHFNIVGRLVDELRAGRSTTARLMRFDKTVTTNQLKVVESGSTQIRFTVWETTTVFDTQPASTIIIAQYDESLGAYALRGWVC